MPITNFRDATPETIDAVIASLTDAEWGLLEQGYLDIVHQQIADWFTRPLGMDVEVMDGSALFCRLYRISLSRTTGA